MYDLNICYATDGGAKTQKLNVNGNAAGDLALSNHTDFSESNVARIKLNAGENELEFVSYWGWTQFDYIDSYLNGFTCIPHMNNLATASTCNFFYFCRNTGYFTIHAKQK